MNTSERDQRIIWHPYTQAKTASPPLAVKRASGAEIELEDGRTLIDGVSSWWVNLHGHSHPYIAEKVSAQLREIEHVIFAGFTHAPAVQLAERLLAKLPKNQARVFFSDNGSTAVEVALKMALQYHRNTGDLKRTKLVAFENGYHGDTFGTMSVSGKSAFTAPFEPFLFPIERIPAPETPALLEQACEKLQKLCASGTVAAFLYEPLIQGAGGMRMHSVDALSHLLQIAQKSGTLLIADEVMTGFHRTGRFLASETATPPPDLICLSKGLTGGTLPMALTTCTSPIFEAFLSNEASHTFFHGHSYTGNPVGCAAALASLDLLEKPECQKAIQSLCEAQSAFMREIQEKHPVLSARTSGTVFSLDFQGQGYLDPLGPQLYRYFLEQGCLLRPLGNTVYLMPPYCTTASQLDHLQKTIREAIQRFSR